MASNSLDDRLAALYQKRDHIDQFYDADLKTIIDAIRDAREHGGTASVDITPISGGGGYTIIITDSEGTEHTATVKDGGDAYEVYKSTVPSGQTPMSKTDWLASLKGADGANGQDGADGVTPTIDPTTKQWMIGTTPTGVLAEGHNHNRGTYNVGDTFPSDGIAGDYIVVVDDSQSTPTAEIYKWDTSQSDWSQTGVSPNDAAFEDGQLLPNTKIDDTKLANPAANALAKAVDVVPLKYSLGGLNYAVQLPQMTPNNGYVINGTDGQTFNNQYGGYVIVAVEGYDKVTFNGFKLRSELSEDNVGYCFGVMSNGVWTPTSATAKKYAKNTTNTTIYSEYTEDVPANVTHIAVTYKFGGLNTSNFYLYLEKGKKVQEQIDVLTSDCETFDERVDKIEGEITEREVLEVDFSSVPTQRTELGPTSIQYPISSYESELYCVDIRGYDEIRIQRTTGTYYLAICKEKLPVSNSGHITNVEDYVITNCEGYEVASGSTYRMVDSSHDLRTIKLTSETKYLYIQKKFGGYPYYYTPTLLELIMVKSKLDDSSLTQFNGLLLTRGDINNNGVVIGSEFKLVTNPIPHGKGFAIETKEGYNVERVALYTADGVCINSKYRYAGTNYRYVKGWGSAKYFEKYFVRVVFSSRTNPNSTVVPFDVIENFCYVADARLVARIPNNLHIKQCVNRTAVLSNVVWSPLSAVPYLDSSTYDAGITFVGVPYSEVNEFSKYIGLHVSLRTFLSAVKNKRSVMYTERIRTGGSSKYGFTYHGNLQAQGSFYGTVCSGLVAYLMDAASVQTANNIKQEYESNIYAKNVTGSYIAIKDGNSFENATIDDLWNVIEPLDILWSSGHIAVITNVYKNVYGDTQLIEIAESSTPTVFLTPYTKGQLMSRFVWEVDEHSSSWALIRNDAIWETLLNPQQDYLDLMEGFMNYEPKGVTIDPDISTFAGEYAAFAINADNDNTANTNNYKAFLNIHRNGSKYNTLEIYNESDVIGIDNPVSSISISTTDGTIVKQSDIYTEDAAESEDWIFVDLTALSTTLTAGKYKARLTGSNAESGFTHFEMVDISLSYDTDTHVVSFESSEGTPYLIRKESANGLSPSTDASKELTQEDVNNNSITIDWQFDGTYKYIKLFVRAEYGVVVKRIEIN